MANLSTSFQFWQLPKYDQRKDESSLTLQTSNKLPKPGPGEALIRIRAVSLNYRDLIISRNLYPSSNLERDELIPGSDGAGDIVEIGEKVENFRIGDRVVANFNPAFKRGMVAKEKEMKSALGGPAQGILTSLIVLPVDALLRIPSHLSYEEASTLPCAAVTAWNGLYGLRDIPLLPGANVLVEGTGGVSIFAAQFAIAAGARVIITSSSDEKLEKVRKLFNKEEQDRLFTINYRTIPEWDQEVLRITGEDKVSHIIEVGGAGTIEKAHKVIMRGGVIANIGFVSEETKMPNIPLQNLFSGSIYRGTYVGSVEQFEQMNRAIEAFKIKPLIDKVFDFRDAQKAYAYQWAQTHVGKVVIKVE